MDIDAASLTPQSEPGGSEPASPDAAPGSRADAAPSAASGDDAPRPLLRTLQLLTVRYETLGLGERAAALLQARVAGKAAAEAADSREELESGPALGYHRHVVQPAEQSGFAEADTAADWKLALEEGKALRDPRVQAFLFGWHERAMEILADLEAGEGDEPVRAQWFLSGLKP